MKICFHKWQHLTFQGEKVSKDNPEACLKYCTKCKTRRSKAIISEFLYWFIPIPVGIQFKYWKFPRKPWWRKI
jgi:hypothetical protein